MGRVKVVHTIWLHAGSYKEQHRLAMIKWSEEIRNADYTYFCKAAVEKYMKNLRTQICFSDSLDSDGLNNFRYEADNFPVWIVSDCRRETDLRYFSEKFGDRVKRVRIVAEDKVRAERRVMKSICIFVIFCFSEVGCLLLKLTIRKASVDLTGNFCFMG